MYSLLAAEAEAALEMVKAEGEAVIQPLQNLLSSQLVPLTKLLLQMEVLGVVTGMLQDLREGPPPPSILLLQADLGEIVFMVETEPKAEMGVPEEAEETVMKTARAVLVGLTAPMAEIPIMLEALDKALLLENSGNLLVISIPAAVVEERQTMNGFMRGVLAARAAVVVAETPEHP